MGDALSDAYREECEERAEYRLLEELLREEKDKQKRALVALLNFLEQPRSRQRRLKAKQLLSTFENIDVDNFVEKLCQGSLSEWAQLIAAVDRESSFGRRLLALSPWKDRLVTMGSYEDDELCITLNRTALRALGIRLKGDTAALVVSIQLSKMFQAEKVKKPLFIQPASIRNREWRHVRV